MTHVRLNTFFRSASLWCAGCGCYCNRRAASRLCEPDCHNVEDWLKSVCFAFTRQVPRLTWEVSGLVKLTLLSPALPAPRGRMCAGEGEAPKSFVFSAQWGCFLLLEWCFHPELELQLFSAFSTGSQSRVLGERRSWPCARSACRWWSGESCLLCMLCSSLSSGSLSRCWLVRREMVAPLLGRAGRPGCIQSAKKTRVLIFKRVWW